MKAHTSFSVTYEPMAFMRLGKKKKRNQLRFSRKRLVSAMQPGYLVGGRVQGES